MNILHIDSSPRGEASHSRRIAHQLIETLKQKHTNATVVYRDLGHNPPPFVNEAWAVAAYSPEDQRTPEQQAALKYSDAAIDELLAADVIVCGSPMYNLTISADLKAWFDQVIRINRTFTADYKGLATGKKVYVVTSRGGGGYGPGEAMEKINFQDPYLKTAFGFIGITDVEFIHLNNTAKGEDALKETNDSAHKAIAAIAAA